MDYNVFFIIMEALLGKWGNLIQLIYRKVHSFSSPQANVELVIIPVMLLAGVIVLF